MMAAGLVQLLLILMLFTSESLDFMLDLTAALALIPYLLAAGYMLKLTATRETYADGKSLGRDTVIAALATLYTLFLVYAAGFDKLLLSCILYAPGALLYRNCPPRAQSAGIPPIRGGVVRDHCLRSGRGRGVPGDRRRSRSRQGKER